MARGRLVLLALFSLLLGGALFAAKEELTPAQNDFFARLPEVRTISLNDQGVPDFVAGRLGKIDSINEADAVNFLRSFYPAFKANGNEELRAVRGTQDELGQMHLRFQQYLNNLPVLGAELILHVDAATGEVLAVNGTFCPDTDNMLPSTPMINYFDAMDVAIEEAGIVGGQIMARPKLTYVMDNGKAYLAWSTKVSYYDETGVFHVDQLFASAITGDMVARHGLIKEALNRKIYTAKNGTSTPGTLLFSEGGSSTDSAATALYNHLGTTYNYYSARYGRDSFNNAGGTLIGTVHYSSNYVNAYWDGSQFVFGDGDGSQASNLAADLDVVAHEYTHGVTENEGNMNYSNEPGALNEACSDIFAVSASAYKDGAISANTWLVGEYCWTPGTSGDALRYMNNPTLDDSSYDYYPERYTGTSDYGGVHLNSGIGNLAYYLLCQGGTHPRSKTTTVVTGIGMTKAEQIWYRALCNYFTTTTSFAAARTATMQAATDLYGATESNEVGNSWAAVGVGSGGTTPTTTVTLTNGVALGSQSVSSGSYLYYKITVPSGQTSLVVKTTGGSGDADLYVKAGAQPSSSSYDSSSTGSTSVETVTISNPSAADYYIALYGYSASSGITITATYTGGGTTPTVPVLTNGTPVTGISVAKSAYAYYKITVPSGQTSLVVKTTAGSADCDLYVKAGAQPTTASYDGKSTGSTAVETVTISNPTAGDYYIGIYGYAAASGISLVATYSAGTTPPAGNTETESNNTTSTANTLTSGTATTGYIGTSTDVDYFKVTVPASTTLYVTLDVPTGKDYDVKIYNSSNTQVAYGSNGSGVDESISYRNSATTSKVFYIKVYGYSSAYSATLSYIVKATF